MEESLKKEKKESMYQERREELKRALFSNSVSMQIVVLYLEGTENDLHAYRETNEIMVDISTHLLKTSRVIWSDLERSIKCLKENIFCLTFSEDVHAHI